MEFKDLDDKDGVVPDDDGAPDDTDIDRDDDEFEYEDPDMGPDVLPVDEEDEDTRDTDPNAVVPEGSRRPDEMDMPYEDALDHLTTEEIDEELGI